jgi:predicted metal-dependent hydrolase
VEQSQVQFGRTAIPYSIHRGRRQKTVAIGVDPIDGVRVRAPEDTPVAKLDEIVHRKARWIIARRRRCEDAPPSPTPKEFVSGETFLYLGRQYRLKLDHTKPVRNDRVRLAGRHLHVGVAARSLGATEVRDLLIAWYESHATRRLAERVDEWAPRLRVAPRSVLIRNQRKRWGSVDARGNVRLNWRVVQAPKRLIDYVVAHELAHLRYADHTRDFWTSLGHVMSDYEERRESLRKLGPVMVW